MSNNVRSELLHAVATGGYHPEAVSAAVVDAIGEEPVTAYIVHHEPTFDRHEVRRHLSVLALTPSRLIVTHTDDHPGDALLPEPYTSTTAESIALERVTAVSVTRIVTNSSHALREALLTISWGNVSRVDLEPAVCDDPDCTADHGYSGALVGDDFSIRISAAAEGGHALENLLEFAKALNTAGVQTRAVS